MAVRLVIKHKLMQVRVRGLVWHTCGHAHTQLGSPDNLHASFFLSKCNYRRASFPLNLDNENVGVWFFSGFLWWLQLPCVYLWLVEVDDHTIRPQISILVARSYNVVFIIMPVDIILLPTPVKSLLLD